MLNRLKRTLVTGTLALGASMAQAGAIHDAALFTDNTLARNDDGSTGLVSMGFTVNFFGQNFSQLFVNNNGNVTFDAALSTFTPFPLAGTNREILAPFFGDVDTRNLGSGVTQYGQDVLGGHAVFGVNWIGVGYYNQQIDKLNSFQLILTDRSDIAPGDFDFEFNYDQIDWETGAASGGVGGLGGNSARVGWSNGVAMSFELPGSAVNGAFLDSNPGGLIFDSLNSSTLGQYVFQVRNGQVVVDGVPEPGTVGLLTLGLAGLAILRRRKG